MSNYKSLENVIRDVARGNAEKSKYVVLEHSIRNLMEVKGTPHYIENDPNDQIAVGTYKTKNFEINDEAQKLYANLPKDTDKIAAERSAILHDQLFGIHKDVLARGRASQTQVDTANELVNKIRKLADTMKMSKEHGYLDRVIHDFNRHLDTTGNTFDANTLDVKDIETRFSTPSKDQTKEKQDSDVDNSKWFVTRSIKAQRKIKIVDDD